MIFSQRRHLAWNQGSQLCTTPAPKMASFENQGMSALRYRQGPLQRWHLVWNQRISALHHGNTKYGIFCETKGSQLCTTPAPKTASFVELKDLSSAPQQHQKRHLCGTKGCQLCTTATPKTASLWN